MITKVEYYKQHKPRTLKQFLINKAVKEKSAEVRNVHGIERDKDGRLMPKSAVLMKEKMKGMSAERVAQEHPEWVKEYPDYVKQWESRYREGW